MAKVIVTGGLGFVGSNLVDKLIDGGNEVLVLDNVSTGSWENKNPKARYLEMDIRDINDVQISDFVPSVIFHIAAKARIQPSLKDPVGTCQNNIDGTLQILEYARTHQCKVI